jgi:succinyl-diaminopimelate desuccinylase
LRRRSQLAQPAIDQGKKVGRVGLRTTDVKATLRQQLTQIPSIQLRVVQQYEPNFTEPSHEIVTAVTNAATEVLGQQPAVNMRVGASDARLYRMFGVPSAVFGPTPYNMGGPDEHVRLDELLAVAKVHALAAFRFLSAK